MDLEKARKRMESHIDGQAKWQGQVVEVQFLREDAETSDQIFQLKTGPKTAEVRLSKEDLEMPPALLMAIDEKISAALDQL